MVIDMNEAQVRTLQQVRQVLAGTQAMEFQATADDADRYAWIESVLRRFEYRGLPRADRGAVLVYLQHLSGYSRAQITRLVSRCIEDVWLAPITLAGALTHQICCGGCAVASCSLLPAGWSGPGA